MKIKSDWTDRSLRDHPDQGPAFTTSSNTNAPSISSFVHRLSAVCLQQRGSRSHIIIIIACSITHRKATAISSIARVCKGRGDRASSSSKVASRQFPKYNRTQGAGARSPSSFERLLGLGVMPTTCRVPPKHLNRGAIAVGTQARHWTRVLFAILRMFFVAIPSRVYLNKYSTIILATYFMSLLCWRQSMFMVSLDVKLTQSVEKPGSSTDRATESVDHLYAGPSESESFLDASNGKNGGLSQEAAVRS